VTTSAFNTGIAAGSAIAGTALDSTLRLTGPPLVGTVIAALTLLPLIALAVHGPSHKGRIVARSSAPTQRRRDEPAEVPSQH
jgi:DHA1 family inner membrane transport protein